jgi:hypothetical protein
MEDISQKISELLGSPDGMSKIKAAAEELLGSGVFNAEQNKDNTVQSTALSLPENLMENMGNLEGIMKIARLFSGEQRDSRIELLRALKPHLSNDRKKRVDKAISILKVATLLPVLKEEGLLENLGF